MDLHKRYIDFPTTDLSILRFADSGYNSDPFSFIHRLVQHYDSMMMSNKLSIKELETFRMILCHEYQLLFNSETNKVRRKTVPNELCFKKIESLIYLKIESENSVDLAITYDIILLHLVLYCNPNCIKEHLEHIQQEKFKFFTKASSRIFYMKVLECFLDSLQLRKCLFNNTELDILKDVTALFINDIVMWLEWKGNKEWQSFFSIFPKTLNTCGSEQVLPIIWNNVLKETGDSKDLLTALSIITDTCFSLKSKNRQHHNLFYKEQLWLLILQNLKSSTKQFRKQALFIMKQITDFMALMDERTLELTKPTIVPFVCESEAGAIVSIAEIREKFYLILEALEEKQYHLIAPALTHVPKLVKGNKEHKLCNDCFSDAWLHLIFERIFQHENHTVARLGVQYVCESHTILHDRQFLKLFVPVLNNTFLYECKFYQHEPEILNNIVTLFIRAQEEEVDFINKFFMIMNEIMWAPIPIFYMMLILKVVSKRISNSWEGNELLVAKSLVQKNLTMHSHVLRIASQIELLETISLSVKKINDLKTLLDVLLEFPPEEALVRYSFSWNLMTLSLKNALKVTDAIAFVKAACSSENRLSMDPAKFALVILMLYDAGLIIQNRACPVEGILNDWLLSLNKISTRLYVDNMQIFYIIETMSHFLNLNTTGSSRSITQIFISQADNALKFLLRIFTKIPFEFSYEDVKRYLAVVVLFLQNGNLVLPKSDIMNYVKQFKDASILTLQYKEQYTDVHYMSALHILHCTENILNVDSCRFHTQPLLDIVQNDQELKISKGKIASDCYLLLTKLTNEVLSKAVDIRLIDINWLETISRLYEKGGNEIVPEIALVLKAVNERGLINSENRSQFQVIFNTCWKATLLSTKNKVYFRAIKNLLSVILNNNFLILPDALDFVKEIVSQLFDESEDVPKLKKILLDEMKLLNACSLKSLSEPLLVCLLHGHVLRKDKQIENQAYVYIVKNYKNCYPEHLQIMDYDIDANIRALSVILLHKLINVNEKHASVLLQILIQKLEKYRNKRYFNYSYIHKVKQRIMQALLILQPILNKTDSAILQELLCDLILLESNQHSVRLLQEWILIRIFIKHIELQGKLWEFFEKAIATRPGCISSVVCIVYHVSKLISEEHQHNFILTGLKYIAQCCLGQQYNMRLYSQVVFTKMYDMLNKLKCNDIVKEFRGLYDATVISLQDGKFRKHSNRIFSDFYLSDFHPTEDYNLETIYFELPRLADMDASEWITVDLFEALKFKESSNHPLQLQNLNKSLSQIKISTSIESTADADSLTNNSLFENMKNLEELSDIQKKIDPSPARFSNSDNYSSIRESIVNKRMHSKEGIILVASFIDRIPNLGGLARTCEIFDVKELVVANSNVTKDKDFQNLSVSAEKWIIITEVKPFEIGKYLLDKKNAGWHLVGIEQTANSTNLLNTKFEKKTILVLGNEKDGIPANLIPLFDTCIEIPQLGIIRSLNVHVSGAICIWEYSKQHILA